MGSTGVRGILNLMTCYRGLDPRNRACSDYALSSLMILQCRHSNVKLGFVEHPEVAHMVSVLVAQHDVSDIFWAKPQRPETSADRYPIDWASRVEDYHVVSTQNLRNPRIHLPMAWAPRVLRVERKNNNAKLPPMKWLAEK